MHLSLNCARLARATRSVSDAAYVFFSAMTPACLELLDDIRTGTFDYPDDSATLLIACDLETTTGNAWSLRGPGIEHETCITLSGLPDGFFEARERRLRYPLGFDAFFVGAGSVVGLPRTTAVTPCM